MHILNPLFIKDLPWLKILTFTYRTLFILACGLAFTFVYDCEPLDPVKEYMLEKEIFDRNNDNWFQEFQSFGDWMKEREDNHDRFKEWLKNLNEELGYQAAETFDWSYQRPYQDTREGHPAQAPEHDQNDHDFDRN